MPIDIISHVWGLRLGGFADRYEVAISADRETALRRLQECFRELGSISFGRGYDGSFLFIFSPRHEVSVFIEPGKLRFADRFHGPVWFRLGRSQLRRKLPWIVASLIG